MPVDFTALGSTLDGYVNELIKSADTMRTETDERNKWIADGTIAMTLDPTRSDRVPEPKAPVPFLNFAPLQNAVLKLRASAKAFDTAYSSAGTRTPDQGKAMDALLVAADRAMLRTQGLPRRPWFQHQFYAPGFYTGYGVKTLPGVREAMEQRDWKEMDAQITVLAETIAQVAERINNATRALKPR